MEPYDATRFSLDRCRPFLHEGGEKGVLLVHGFTGSVAHMRPLGDALADLGYTTMGLNLPGHAQTEADMALTDWRDWLAAVRNAALELRRRCAFVTVAGLSMGALLALLTAAEGLADACVTLSAPLPMHNRAAWLEPVVAPFYPRVSKPPAAERHERIDATFDFGYSGYPTRKLGDLMHLIRLTKKELPNVTCPLLAVQSTGDGAIRQSSADTILRLAGSVQKQLLVLDGVHHVCTLSPALPQIVLAIDALQKSL